MNCLICGQEIPSGVTPYLISNNKGLVLDACSDCNTKAEKLGANDEIKSTDGHFTIKKSSDGYEITYS